MTEAVRIETNQEEINEVLLKHNLKMMGSDMHRLLFSESIGGNAGAYESNGIYYSCGAANLNVNPETGEIMAFGNFQNIPQEILDKTARLIFKVAIDLKGEYKKYHNGFFRIIETYGLDNLNQNARRVIEKSVEDYNEYDIKLVKKVV